MHISIVGHDCISIGAKAIAFPRHDAAENNENGALPQSVNAALPQIWHAHTIDTSPARYAKFRRESAFADWFESL